MKKIVFAIFLLAALVILAIFDKTGFATFLGVLLFMVLVSNDL
jgi:hypothetical protein